MWELAQHLVIVKGAGQSTYKLNSFDNALLDAKIANYNHSVQSSIIPPGCTLHFGNNLNRLPPEGAILPTIYSRKHGVKDERICSGLAFGVNTDPTLPGLVYEYQGENAFEVESVLKDMLSRAAKARKWKLAPMQVVTCSLTVTEFYGCALVAAVLLP